MTGSPFTPRRVPVRNHGLPDHVAADLDAYADEHDLTAADRDRLKQVVARERKARR